MQFGILRAVFYRAISGGGARAADDKNGRFKKGNCEMDERNAAMLAARRLAPIDLYRETTIGNRMPSSKLRNPSLLDRTIVRLPPAPSVLTVVASRPRFFLAAVSRFFDRLYSHIGYTELSAQN